MGSTKTQFESKEALVLAMGSALIQLALETDTPDEILVEYQAELEEIKNCSEEELRERGLIK